MPITDYVLEYNNFSLGNEDSENIASERYENRRLIVLSHWPHVAEQVRRQVAAHVTSVKGLGHKLPNLLLNLCPSPFTLATCAATSVRGA